MAESCKAYLSPPSGTAPATDDGVYWLRAGMGESYRAYCLMERFGGGWTLALKADGRKSTFAYGADLWTNDSTYRASDYKLDTKEAKLRSFTAIAFSGILLGMRDFRRSDIKYVKLGHSDGSLQNLFDDSSNDEIDDPAKTGDWLDLFSDSSLQPNCKEQVVNFTVDKEYRTDRFTSVLGQLRIGILGNNEKDCGTVDSFIGIGSRMYHLGGIVTTGNYSGHSGGSNGKKNTPGFGYLFIR